MRQIDRYLGRSLLGGAALALLALAAVDAMISLVDEVKDVDDDYTLSDAALYTLLMLVAGVYELLPVAVLVGAVISLGNLAAQSELVAFRALHYSRARITASVLKTGAALMLFTFALGETVVPAAVNQAHDIKHHRPESPHTPDMPDSADGRHVNRTDTASGGVSDSAASPPSDSPPSVWHRDMPESADGRWLRDGRNFIHISTASGEDLRHSREGRNPAPARHSRENRNPAPARHSCESRNPHTGVSNGASGGSSDNTPVACYNAVRVYQINDEHHLARIIEAGHAQVTPDEWILADVTLSELRGDEVSITRQHRLRLPRAAPSGIGVGEDELAELNPAAMNIVQLFDYVQFLRASKLSGARAELALWTRFSAALSIIVMLLLAMPWIFFSARSAGSGKRLFFAILISLAYMIGSRVIGDAAVVWQIPPVIGAFLPVLLFAAAGAALLKRLQSG